MLKSQVILRDTCGAATEKETDLLTGQIIGAAIEVHRHLGPGLLESAYDKLRGGGRGLLISFNVPLLKEGMRRFRM